MPHHKLLLRFLSWYGGGPAPTEPTGAIAAIGRELAAIGRELAATGGACSQREGASSQR